MKILIDTYTNTGALHHAYIIEGEREHNRGQLLTFIEKDLQQLVKGNPDFWHRQFESFSIDDARALRDMQATEAISESKKIFVIETITMTIEAQNALLKVFEEPTPQTHFFILVPSQEIFLPTLRSRVIIIRDAEVSQNTLAKSFLNASIPERLKIVGEIAEEKNKAQAIDLVNGLITDLYSKKERNSFIMEELMNVRLYLNDRSPSLKLLLEHIALIIA